MSALIQTVEGQETNRKLHHLCNTTSGGKCSRIIYYVLRSFNTIISKLSNISKSRISSFTIIKIYNVTHKT